MQTAATFLRRRFVPTHSFVRHYLYPRSFIQWLKNEKQPQHSQLDNGLHVVTQQKESSHACVCVFADAGARYENECDNGTAHLFEHLVFKATNKTPRDQLQSMINYMGIKLYVSTTRELVTYCAYCQPSQVDRVIALLAECLLDNALCDEDLTEQKHVVYEEMVKLDHNPRALVFDYLHATAFQGTTLANSIVGSSSNLHKNNQNVISGYMSKMLVPCRMCLCVVGAVTHDSIICMANSQFTWSVPARCIENVYRYTGSDVRYRNDALPKAHVAYALEGPPFDNIHTVIMDLASAVLGGWDNTQPGGEDHGVEAAKRASVGKFCDAYKAFNIKYKDTSLWGVQFVSESLDLEDMVFTIQDVLLNICTSLPEGELERAKEELKSRLLHRTTNSYAAAKDIAVHILYNNCHWPTIYDRLDYIDSIKLTDFMNTVFSYVYNKCPVVAAVGPTEGLPDYTRIRAHQYWIRI